MPNTIRCCGPCNRDLIPLMFYPSQVCKAIEGRAAICIECSRTKRRNARARNPLSGVNSCRFRRPVDDLAPAMSFSEIARQLGCTLPAVHTAYKRAIDKLINKPELLATLDELAREQRRLIAMRQMVEVKR